MIYLPIIGALALAGATVFQRAVLKKKNISVKQYFIFEFFSIILVMLPFVFFFWNISSEAYTLRNILILGIVVAFSIIANVFTFYSMKWEKVSRLEPAKMLEPLFVILFAIVLSFFIPGFHERNPKVILPAIIAGLALIFSHVKKHHLKFNKYFIAAIFGSIFFALELVTSNLILEYYSSSTFYFVRCLLILIFSIFIFHPKLGGIEGKNKLYMLGIGAFWVIFRIVTYWGYSTLGVISTTLILMLGPVFIYAFARIFLKEKLNWRNIIASIIILGCVLYSLFI